MSYNPIKVLHVFGGMNRGGQKPIMNVYRNINREKFHLILQRQNEKCGIMMMRLSLWEAIYIIYQKKGRAVMLE